MKNIVKTMPANKTKKELFTTFLFLLVQSALNS